MKKTLKFTALLGFGLLMMGSECDEGPEMQSPNPGAPAAGPSSLPSNFGPNTSRPDNTPQSGEQPVARPTEDDVTGGEATGSGSLRVGQACTETAACGDGLACEAGFCASAGELRIALIWEGRTDLDLHVLTPRGEEIYYRNRVAVDGGQFLKDGCIADRCEGNAGPFSEAVLWEGIPTAGTYEMWAVNYDGVEATSARFEIRHNGQLETYNVQIGGNTGAKSDVFTYAIEGDDRAPHGTPIGTFRNTYYYLAQESAHSGSPTAKLYDRNCNVLATVSSSFANAACIEGSAQLANGQVINYATARSCGGPCSYTWSVMNPATHPWGKGSRGNALEPLRSWAVDKNVIVHGTVLYVEEWDGLQVPSLDGLGGYQHDGCFRADDVGGAIRGKHVDIFTGSRNMWQALEAIFPTRTNFQVYKDSPRCSHL